MKHLITGGAGFLGYHLAAALVERGDQVDLVDDLSRGTLDGDFARLLEHPNTRLIRADLTDPACASEWHDDYDTVSHLAGIVGVRNVLANPARVLATNARATLNMLDWFERSRSKRFLFASTSEVYAWTMQFHDLPIPTPEDVPLAVDSIENDRASYALSKIFGEMAVRQTCSRAGRTHVIVRYHNIYGPRMGHDHVIPEIHARIRACQRPLTVYSPDEKRAFCFVSDAVDATVRLLTMNGAAGVYNVGNDREEVAIRELARLMLSLSGAPDQIVEDTTRRHGIPRRCPELSRLRSAVGYEPAVMLRQGLQSTMTWYDREAHPAAVESE